MFIPCFVFFSLAREQISSFSRLIKFSNFLRNYLYRFIHSWRCISRATEIVAREFVSSHFYQVSFDYFLYFSSVLLRRPFRAGCTVIVVSVVFRSLLTLRIIIFLDLRYFMLSCQLSPPNLYPFVWLQVLRRSRRWNQITNTQLRKVTVVCCQHTIYSSITIYS